MSVGNLPAGNFGTGAVERASVDSLPQRVLIAVSALPCEAALAEWLGEPLREVAAYRPPADGSDPRELDPATGIPRQPAQPGQYRVVLCAADLPGVVSTFHLRGQIVEIGLADDGWNDPRERRELVTLIERLLYRHRLEAALALDDRWRAILEQGAKKSGTPVIDAR